jgi:molybdenum cofactor biosynthesis protein B
MGTRQHKKDTPGQLLVGVLTISTTRTLVDDKSGAWIAGRAKKEGHTVVLHRVVPDDAATISAAVLEAITQASPQALILTGGTGISSKDVTIEAVKPYFKKELSAFGPIFTQLSFEKIDSAALLSRATAGVVGSTIVFCIPGSLNACKLACKALIFPELGHLVKHIRE